MWEVKCDCGNLYISSGSNLKSGHTISCGCFRIKSTKENRSKVNEYDLETYDYGIGWTSDGTEFKFDKEDFDKIKQYRWRHLNLDGYHKIEAYNKEDCENGFPKGQMIPMHYIVTGKKYMDHINRDPTDNQKSNLREATDRENICNRSKSKRNTSGVIGVNRHKNGNWVARISPESYKNKQIYYGPSFHDAVVARLKAEKRYYGEFAPQQHLYKEYGIE